MSTNANDEDRQRYLPEPSSSSLSDRKKIISKFYGKHTPLAIATAAKMCLIETYLQMNAQIDAAEAIKPTTTSVATAVVADVDDEQVENLSQQIQNLNTTPNDTCSVKSSESSESSSTFEQLFRMFAKFGDSKSSGETITLTNSDKWFKQAKIIDPKTSGGITTTDTGIYFKQIAKTKKALTLKEYQQFLEKLAQVRKVDLAELKNKLQSSGPPATNKTTTAQTGGAIGRLTDHTKYTGSHKQRFDESGRGRGKAGRVDVPSNTGYVSGFKTTTASSTAN